MPDSHPYLKFLTNPRPAPGPLTIHFSGALSRQSDGIRPKSVSEATSNASILCIRTPANSHGPANFVRKPHIPRGPRGNVVQGRKNPSRAWAGTTFFVPSRVVFQASAKPSPDPPAAPEHPPKIGANRLVEGATGGLEWVRKGCGPWSLLGHIAHSRGKEVLKFRFKFHSQGSPAQPLSAALGLERRTLQLEVKAFPNYLGGAPETPSRGLDPSWRRLGNVVPG